MRKPDEIDLRTAVKLASLVIHCREMLSPTGHSFDREATFDPALLPVLR